MGSFSRRCRTGWNQDRQKRRGQRRLSGFLL